jgi:uncharacterized protein (TIGR03437 family)
VPPSEGALINPRQSPPAFPETVTAQIGTSPAQVIYAGGAPLLVEGVFQVNVQVPADVTLGPNALIVLKFGNGASLSYCLPSVW